MITVDDHALRALLENMPVAVGVAEPVEPDGTIRPEARVVYYNKKWKEMFGFSTDEVKTVKQATGRLYPDPEVFAHMIRMRQEAAARRLADGSSEQTEARAMGAGGQWLDVVTGTTVIGDRLVVTMLDITARKRAERALAEALASETAARAAAEGAARAKSLFLANVSHEIRTPLSALVALAQAMWLESEAHNLSPEFTTFLDRVRSGGNYLNLILTNLLDVSAAESGHSPIRPEEFYLRDWTDDVGNILEPVARSHRASLAWELPPDAELRFRTDQLRLTQIALNLAHNAIKFGGEGKTVRIAADVVAGELVFAISDEGPGVPPHCLADLFGEFSQSEMRAPAFDRGVGLGLAVVKQNVELLGGKIFAENLQPHGLRIGAVLPPLGER